MSRIFDPVAELLTLHEEIVESQHEIKQGNRTTAANKLVE